MKRLFIVAILFFFAACKNENHKGVAAFAKNKKDSLMRILTYGISAQQGAADVFVAKQYGFYYYPVTGCVVTKQLIDSINKENNRVYHALAQEYGDNWKQQLNKKVDSLSILFKQVKEVVSHQPNIQTSRSHETNSSYYHIVPTDTANIFDVQVFDANTNNRQSYTLKVNLQTRQVDRMQ